MYVKIIKPVFDFIVALCALPFFFILWLVVAIAIKMEDGGPVFYMAERIGKDGKIFKMFKFRSMKVNAPIMYGADGASYSGKDDPRVTKVGNFIRETSIDEIPQILNILKGDIALIGPRARGTDSLGTFEDDELDLMKVKPGLTGWCQAYYRNSQPPRVKRLKDAWYANNISFVLDAKIFFKTVETVLLRKNVHKD